MGGVGWTELTDWVVEGVCWAVVCWAGEAKGGKGGKGVFVGLWLICGQRVGCRVSVRKR